MTKAERALLQNMKLSPQEYDFLNELYLSPYKHPMRPTKRSEWRWLDLLVLKGFVERDLTATMPRAYRITEAGKARILNPIELLV